MGIPKVCYVSPLSIHTQRWMEAFSSRGYSLSLITDCSAWVAPVILFAKLYNIPTLNKINLPRRFAPNTVRITKILKEINPNLVHLHVQHLYGFALIRSGYPFLLTSWGAEVLSLPRTSLFGKSIARLVTSRACFVTVDANCLKNIWLDLGVPESKIKVIPFGVNLGTFNPDVEGSTVRRNLGIEKDDTAIISTRALDNNHYNVECLVRAIPLVVKRCQSAKFILKGAGPLKAYLQHLVKKLNVSDHVRFVGLTPHHEVAQYLAAADIYVSTPFIDTTSVSLLEAMACKLPPITTDIEGNREWITDGENGLLYPPKDSTILAEKIIQLINNETTRRRFGERCFQIVKERASWEDCVNKMEAIYQSML